jgi:hypothetical protein
MEDQQPDQVPPKEKETVWNKLKHYGWGFAVSSLAIYLSTLGADLVRGLCLAIAVVFAAVAFHQTFARNRISRTIAAATVFSIVAVGLFFFAHIGNKKSDAQDVTTTHPTLAAPTAKQLAEEIAKQLPAPSHDKEIIEQQPVKVTAIAKAAKKPANSAASNGVAIPPGTTITATTNAPHSAAVGINTGTINVNAEPPERNWKLSKAKCNILLGDLKGTSGAMNVGWFMSNSDGAHVAEELSQCLQQAPGWSITRAFLPTDADSVNVYAASRDDARAILQMLEDADFTLGVSFSLRERPR